ncbi:hypothetical protein BDV33DRAFT_186034, partial [Aspergillus novoparasiticus]
MKIKSQCWPEWMTQVGFYITIITYYPSTIYTALLKDENLFPVVAAVGHDETPCFHCVP